jgi:glucose/arabinose dehydrogenase
MGLAGIGLLVVALLTLGPWSSPNSNAEVLRQGDTNCDQIVNAADGLGDLQVAAAVQPTPLCAFAGDIDCSGEVDTKDAISIVRYAAGLPTASSAAAQGACPAIGEPIGTTTPTTSSTTSGGSATSTVTPTPTTSRSPTPTQPPVTPTPTATPTPNTYTAQESLSAASLGPGANDAIEFATIPGHPTEAIIAQQSGYLYRISLTGAFQPTLWGDIHTLVTFGGEQGLLSFAFSPDFETDSRVYMYYSPPNLAPTILSRFTATATALDENSEEPLIHVEEFAANHNGGQIIFDSSGYLYLSLGDGGMQHDPRERGQGKNTLLGKIIRIDVSSQTGYTIPPDNPFSGSACPTPRPQTDGATCSEIFAYGFRNPFRISFDAVSGQIWAGDVGQDNWEEVDKVTNGGNYGWDCREGSHDHNDTANGGDYPNLPCTGPFIAPRAEYDHGGGRQDVIGGVIYRGSNMPELYGWYVYADFASGDMYAVNTGDNSPPVQLGKLSINVSEFVLAADGEIYMLAYGSPYGPAGLYMLARD